MASPAKMYTKKYTGVPKKAVSRGTRKQVAQPCLWRPF